MARSFSYKDREIFRKIILPSSLVDIFVGARIGLGYAYRSIIAAEMLAASKGLGYLINFSRLMSRTDKVLVGIFMIGFIGMISDKIFVKFASLFLKGDLTFNTTIANLKQYKSGIALSDSKMEKATAEEIKTMRTKCMGPNDMISNLSGGNQQKVIFGKWLEREPQVFMMDEPTRGIDVGAKYEIYELIINMAKQGRTIIVVSSEMPEILGITNRIGVMSNGYLSGIVNTKETNQEELLRLSAKYL